MKKSMLSFLVLGLSFLFSTDESVFLKQVELENIYKFKIVSFLEKIYDKSEYYVFADVRLEKKPQPKLIIRSISYCKNKTKISNSQKCFFLYLACAVSNK